MDIEAKVYNKLIEIGVVGASLKYIEELINIVDEHRKEQLNLPVVNRSLKEKHLDTFEEFLKYHCEKQDDYQYIYKGHEYWKRNLVYVYEEVKNNQP